MEEKEKKITEVPMNRLCTIAKVQGDERLRLFDLGFFHGSQILPLYECAGGGTRVYRVKDTLIALRNSDGENIFAEEEAQHV